MAMSCMILLHMKHVHDSTHHLYHEVIPMHLIPILRTMCCPPYYQRHNPVCTYLYSNQCTTCSMMWVWSPHAVMVGPMKVTCAACGLCTIPVMPPGWCLTIIIAFGRTGDIGIPSCVTRHGGCHGRDCRRLGRCLNRSCRGIPRGNFSRK